VADPDKLPGGDVRVSDHDRSRITAELQRHCIEGRITVEELDRRAAQAIAARTTHELARVVYDLPRARIGGAPGPPARPVKIGPPGIRPFTQRIVVPAQVERTRTLLLETLAQSLNAKGYELTRQNPTGLRFERRKGWLGRVRERIIIGFEPTPEDETVMIVHGSATWRIRRTFAKLAFR
jgi:hypothetical protein